MEQDVTDIEKMIDEVTPIGRATAPVFFAEKVMRRFQQSNEPAVVWYQWILYKPALLSATLLLFFLINCWIIKSSFNRTATLSVNNISPLQQLSVDLNITSENNLPYK